MFVKETARPLKNGYRCSRRLLRGSISSTLIGESQMPRRRQFPYASIPYPTSLKRRTVKNRDTSFAIPNGERWFESSRRRMPMSSSGLGHLKMTGLVRFILSSFFVYIKNASRCRLEFHRLVIERLSVRPRLARKFFAIAQLAER